jgi:hypothetical protein
MTGLLKKHRARGRGDLFKFVLVGNSGVMYACFLFLL